MRFCGNEICCGSYACLNAIKDKTLDPQLFEISTTAPFGIKHFENAYFDRLLTTYRDPGKGIDEAAEIWGYTFIKYEVKTAEEAISYLRKELRNSRAVIGPLDMGSLGYQVMPRLLKRMDHFVALEYWSEDSLLCYDSEGFGGYLLSYTELQNYISVEDVFEAEGKITLRFISGDGERKKLADIIEKACIGAFRNLKNAEAEGEGSEAILKCYDFLKNQDLYRWKLPFLYDIQYLMQRKWLMKVLSQNYQKVINRENDVWKRIEDMVECQIGTAGMIYNGLRLHDRIERGDFERLGECERRLAHCTLTELENGRISICTVNQAQNRGNHGIY